LTLNIPAEPVFVDGDAARITQVFGNVLHNAIKYTGRNGAIDVVLESDRATATVRIRDNGPGIPKPMLSHIFEMFCQVDQTLDRSHGGLGIGLTLVKRLVEMHGGTVEARSDGPGKGSEFLIRLPRLTHDRAKAELSQAPPTLQQIESMPRHRILVVDDVEASARTLAMMLQAMGQEVTALNDGPAALQWVLANRPDIVFLDIAMPGMDGYEVARRIRDSANSDGPLLVALTGYGQDEDRRIALEAGFNRHLTKPANLIALYEILLARPERRRDADTASTLAS
jgi:two-component system CheB/CheR fusion protein